MLITLRVLSKGPSKLVPRLLQEALHNNLSSDPKPKKKRVLTPDEALMAELQLSYIKDVFNVIDTNKDGYISKGELVRATRSYYRYKFNDEELQHLYEQLQQVEYLDYHDFAITMGEKLKLHSWKMEMSVMKKQN